MNLCTSWLRYRPIGKRTQIFTYTYDLISVHATIQREESKVISEQQGSIYIRKGYSAGLRYKREEMDN